MQVAPGLSATAAGVEASVVADRAMVLSLITGGVALVLVYVMNRRHILRPSMTHLQAWEALSTSAAETVQETGAQSLPAGSSVPVAHTAAGPVEMTAVGATVAVAPAPPGRRAGPRRPSRGGRRGGALQGLRGHRAGRPARRGRLHAARQVHRPRPRDGGLGRRRPRRRRGRAPAAGRLDHQGRPGQPGGVRRARRGRPGVLDEGDGHRAADRRLLLHRQRRLRRSHPGPGGGRRGAELPVRTGERRAGRDPVQRLLHGLRPARHRHDHRSRRFRVLRPAADRLAVGGRWAPPRASTRPPWRPSVRWAPSGPVAACSSPGPPSSRSRASPASRCWTWPGRRSCR
ncbi:hypothetical protein ACFSTC_40100 [Nonomuraea ferruginea]